MEDRVGMLDPKTVKAFKQGLAHCASCGAKLDYLEKLGLRDQETRDRLDHIQGVIETALEIHAKSQAGV